MGEDLRVQSLSSHAVCSLLLLCGQKWDLSASCSGLCNRPSPAIVDTSSGNVVKINYFSSCCSLLWNFITEKQKLLKQSHAPLSQSHALLSQGRDVPGLEIRIP